MPKKSSSLDADFEAFLKADKEAQQRTPRCAGCLRVPQEYQAMLLAKYEKGEIGTSLAWRFLLSKGIDITKNQISHHLYSRHQVR